MSNSSNLPLPQQSDDLSDRWGCAVLTVSAVLFAIQRFALFSVLTTSPAAADPSASQIRQFLFGDPPYSLFDTLLGFQIPDQGFLYILQPHNLFLALVQAVHYGANYGVTYGLFWLVHRFTQKTQGRPLLRISGCLGCLVLLAAAALGIATILNAPQPLPARTQSQSSPRAVDGEPCDHDEVQNYIYRTHDIYQMYWPYVDKFAKASNPMGELVANGKWYQEIFHDATQAAKAISPPPCAEEAHSHFIDGWAALGLAGFQADAGNPDLAARQLESAASEFDKWNAWINALQ